MAALQPIDLVDFSGGLNVNSGSVALADNESPDMLNVEVARQSGFYTRKGWERWNDDDVVIDPATWEVRTAKMHPFSTGEFLIFLANQDGKIFWANQGGMFTRLQESGSGANVLGEASPHIADFAAWGDEMWIARGNIATVHVATDGSVSVVNDAATNFNDDYTQPNGTPSAPFAEYVEAHAGYLFAANTTEGGQRYSNRIRWSHPNEPGNWATLDFLDIERGGGRITGLMSFGPRLMIFKTDSVWGLYGYDLDSWQLEEISTSIGLPHLSALTRSENAVYFFSRADLNGVYVYTGEGRPIHISERLRPLMESINDTDNVFVGWAGKRLWCVLPTSSDTELVVPYAHAPPGNSVLVFDPEVGGGTWLQFQAAEGSVGPIVARSDVSDRYPLAAMQGDSGTSCLVRLEYRDDARDQIHTSYTTRLTNSAAVPDDVLTDESDGAILVDSPEGIVPLAAPFKAHYRTSWKHGGWPERRKSWRRPRYIVQTPAENVAVRAEVFWDYNSTRVRRSSLGLFEPTGGAFWTELGSAAPNGFDWGDGTLWGLASAGSDLERATIGMGVNRAISLKVSGEAATLGAAWSIESVHLKHRLRRYTS